MPLKDHREYRCECPELIQYLLRLFINNIYKPLLKNPHPIHSNLPPSHNPTLPKILKGTSPQHTQLKKT